MSQEGEFTRMRVNHANKGSVKDNLHFAMLGLLLGSLQILLHHDQFASNLPCNNGVN